MPDNIALKEGSTVLSAIGVCRTCLIAKGLESCPSAVHPNGGICMTKGCENYTAYLVAVDPFVVKP